MKKRILLILAASAIIVPSLYAIDYAFGTITATTQTAGDNSTKVATTAYVATAINGTNALPSFKPQRQTYLVVTPATAATNSTNFMGVGDTTTVAAGANSGSVAGAYAIGATTNNTTAAFGWSTNSTSGYPMGRNIYMATAAGISQTTNVRAWVGLSDQPLATMVASDSPTGNFLAFRFSSGASDTTWKAVTSNGGTPTVTSTGIAANTTNVQIMTIIQDNTSGNVKFYIDGVLGATVNLTLPASGTKMIWLDGVRALNSAGVTIFGTYAYLFCDMVL